MTDQLLIDLYFARDKRAVAETKEKYGAWCAAIAWRLLRDSRDVEECLSDCALAVWNAFRPAAGALQGWLGAIVRNRAIALGGPAAAGRPQRTRRRWSWPPACPPGTAPRGGRRPPSWGGPSPISCAHRGGGEDGLPPAVLVRRGRGGGGPARLGWSVSKTKSSLFRTRNRLREYLHQEGYL